MVTYADYIKQLRTQTGDTRRRVHVDWIGDGATTIFLMPVGTYPVLDTSPATYVVRVGGVIQTELTQFTLDRETGTLVMNTPPGNGASLTIDSSTVYLQDSAWLQIINDTIRSLGDDFWKEFVNDNLTTTTNMTSLDLKITQPRCIAVYDFWYRTGSSNNWLKVESLTNWRYDRDNNIIYLGDQNTFNISNQPLKVRGLSAYLLGTTTTDLIDVQSRFLTIIEYGSIARYWRYRYKDVVELVSKLSTEPSRTQLQEMIMLSDRFDRLYEIEKSKLKPQKPPRVIPQFIQGGGHP